MTRFLKVTEHLGQLIELGASVLVPHDYAAVSVHESKLLEIVLVVLTDQQTDNSATRCESCIVLLCLDAERAMFSRGWVADRQLAIVCRGRECCGGFCGHDLGPVFVVGSVSIGSINRREDVCKKIMTNSQLCILAVP